MSRLGGIDEPRAQTTFFWTTFFVLFLVCSACFWFGYLLAQSAQAKPECAEVSP